MTELVGTRCARAGHAPGRPPCSRPRARSLSLLALAPLTRLSRLTCRPVADPALGRYAPSTPGRLRAAARERSLDSFDDSGSARLSPRSDPEPPPAAGGGA